MWLVFAALAQTTPAPGPKDGALALQGTDATSSANDIVDLIDWMKMNEPLFDAIFSRPPLVPARKPGAIRRPNSAHSAVRSAVGTLSSLHFRNRP
jgi:hypothetical protein